MLLDEICRQARRISPTAILRLDQDAQCYASSILHLGLSGFGDTRAESLRALGYVLCAELEARGLSCGALWTALGGKEAA